MGRRGPELHQHILFTAKDVFLERGFERASMDEIAERARTSKRTLYAHFENKETLYLAVVELVRGLYLERLKSPPDYSDDATEALVIFCGRFLELLLWTPPIAMCRLAISEAERFKGGSAAFFDAIFETAHMRVTSFLRERFPASSGHDAAADDLIGRVLHPRFLRALFGLDAVSNELPDENHIKPTFDLTAVRQAVAKTLDQLQQS